MVTINNKKNYSCQSLLGASTTLPAFIAALINYAAEFIDLTLTVGDTVDQQLFGFYLHQTSVYVQQKKDTQVYNKV